MGLKKDERERRLAELRVMSDGEYACKYGITEESARKFREKHGIYRPKTLLTDKIPADVQARICELKRKGKSYKEIRLETGASEWGVRVILHANGFEVKGLKKTKRENQEQKQDEENGENGKPPSWESYVTPETAVPYCYRGRGDSCELEPEERERFDELRRWKEEAFYRDIENSEFRDETLQSLTPAT